MKAKKFILKMLPIIAIIVDYFFGYTALVWIVEMIPNANVPQNIMVLITAIFIVIAELMFGSLENKTYQLIGWIPVLVVPLFVLSDGFDKYSNAVLLELPWQQMAQIVCTQVALILFSFMVHIGIFVEAKVILSLYSGENVDDQVKIYFPNREEQETYNGPTRTVNHGSNAEDFTSSLDEGLEDELDGMEGVGEDDG